MSQRVSKKRVQVLVNNLRRTNLAEMEQVVDELLSEFRPQYLVGLFKGTAAMIEAEGHPVPLVGHACDVCHKQDPPKPKFVTVMLTGVSSTGRGNGDNFIHTIKNLRETFGWPLKAAKKTADAVRYHGGELVDYYRETDGRKMIFLEESSTLMELRERMSSCGVLVFTQPVLEDVAID